MNAPITRSIARFQSLSSEVTAKMSNGVLHIELPKKNPTKLEEEEGTTVEIK